MVEKTYKQITQIERYIGPDVQDAPTDCSPGSRFFESTEGSDVGTLYVFDGVKWVKEQSKVTESSDALTEQIMQLGADVATIKVENGQIMGFDGSNWRPVKVNANGELVLSGNIMEIYGATVDDRPPANSVPVGAMYMVVGTEEVWQSNGTDWVVM